MSDKLETGIFETFIRDEDKLTPHQQSVYDKIIPEIHNIIETDGQWDNVVSLIGAAGVGKTFLTIQIIKSIMRYGHSVTITTPTHKALKVAKDMATKENITVNSSTINSFLNLKLKPNLDTGMQELIMEQFSKNKNKSDLLIVDESSMVSAEMYKHIQNSIRFRKAKCVLFIGDWYQLPPVDGEINPVFEMKTQYELTEIVRQAEGSPIIQLATEIRKKIDSGEFIDLATLVQPYNGSIIKLYNDGKQFMSDYFSDKSEKGWFESDQIIASYTNASVDSYNRAVRKKYWKDLGVELESIQYLHLGDTVIFQETHIEDETIVHSNNDIVEITKCEKIFDEKSSLWIWMCEDEESTPFKVIDPLSRGRFEKILKDISTAALRATGWERKQLWESYYNIKAEFQEVKYIYSSTIHKLQGSTYETVYIDLRELRKFYEFQDKEFIYRLLYVAITRASKDIKILL